MAAPNEHVDEAASALPARSVGEVGAALARIPRLSEVSMRSWRIIALASSLAVTAALVLTLALGSPSGGGPAPAPDGTDPATLTQEQQDALALADLVEPLRSLAPDRVGAAEHAALVEALDTLGERARSCCDASLDSARVAVEIAVERTASSTGTIGRRTFDAASPSADRDALGEALATLDAAAAVDARVDAVVRVVQLGAALAGVPAQAQPGAEAGATDAPADAGGSGGARDPWASGRGAGQGPHGGRDHGATPLPVPPEASTPTEPTESTAPPTDPVTTPSPTPTASGGADGESRSPAPTGADGSTWTDLPVAG